MYSGNMGLTHIFQPILEAAEILQERLPEALILFVGDGPQKQWIQNQVEDRSLTNIKMLPFQPHERVGECLGAADIHLVTMRPEVLGLVVPSKVYGILATGKPCLFIGPKECEVARFIEEQSCGEVLNSDSGEGLAERIHAWYLNNVSRIETGRRGQRAVRVARINSFELFRHVLGKEVEHISECS